MFVTKKELERSSLKLVRVIYFKVIDVDKVYYLLEKAFMSDCDGFTDADKITKEEYEMVILKKEKTIEIEYEIVRQGIKNWIKELYIDGK